MPPRLSPRALLLALLSALFSVAGAHPMGSRSVNRSALLSLRPDETRLRYTVDFAEVPSAAEKARLDALGADAYASTRMAELLPRLQLEAGGQPVPLSPARCFANVGEGEGKVPVVMLLCDLTAHALASGPMRFSDHNFEGAVGWRELRVVGEGLNVSEGEPADAVSVGAMPLPFQTAEARMALSTVTATVGAHPEDLSPRLGALALLSALALGAAHALAQGHSEATMHRSGDRGAVGQALLLGLTVTAADIPRVLLIGAIPLWLSEHAVAPELRPWIGVLCGLGVVGIGAGLLRSRGPTGRVNASRAAPSPQVLVVLLSAVALHRVTFGVLLIVAFAVGLAVARMVIGVLVARANPLLDRLSGAGRATWLPVASAAFVIALGLGLAVKSAHEGGIL